MNKTKKKQRQFLTISTGTLGGAIIMLLLNMLLGDDAPWFVERLSVTAKDIYSITLDVEHIFDKENSIQDLDRNIYYVDSKSNYYLKKPPKNLWKIEISNPGSVLDGISLAHIPFLNQSIDAFGKLLGVGTILQDDIITTTFNNIESSYEIMFNDSSEISNLLVKLNPFDDLDYVKASIRSGGALLMYDESETERLLDETTEEGREYLEQAKIDLLEYGNTIIENNWPEDHIFSDNITITTFRKNLIERNIVYKLLFQDTELKIIPALNFLMFVNPELYANIKYIDVSKDNKAILIDASISLKNVMINGNLIDNCELIKLYLVALSPDLIYVIKIQYLYGVGTSRSSSKELEKMFASFRVLS